MASVAGDFYDFAAAGENRIGILVADGAGHGVPAALIASMVKVAFASQSEHAGDPSRVLSGLNRILCEQRTSQFVTAGYLVVDFENKSAVYAGAGHPPLRVFRRADGRVCRFQNNGLFLSFRPEANYPNVEMPIAGGDRLLLYTDGLFEAVNERDEAAPEFADALLEDVSAWSGRKGGNRQDDDLTLLVVDMDIAIPG